MNVLITVSDQKNEADVDFQLSLPWVFPLPIGSELRVDSRESDGSDCVYLKITGYDFFADITANGEAKTEDEIHMYADFSSGRSSHNLEDLRKWLGLESD